MSISEETAFRLIEITWRRHWHSSDFDKLDSNFRHLAFLIGEASEGHDDKHIVDSAGHKKPDAGG